MKIQTIEKIRVFSGKYGWGMSVAKNTGNKEEPKFEREYLNVYFKKGSDPKCKQGEYVDINLDSAELELFVTKDGKHKLQLYVTEYTLAK